ncbi:hypothetical protein CLOM_g12454 [Closterium sp. NIES-68]|nr:hypothetical protein CLOM_g12454 [Closterium sp. NIES-68]
MGRAAMVARAVVVALLVARCCIVPLARAAPVLDPDMGVLEELASAWTRFDGTATWSRGTDCDAMAAVRCDADGHVVALNTSALEDNYNPYCNNLLPEAITALGHLAWLSITDSCLNGTLPAALFSLPNLKHLNFTRNHFSGSMPDSVGGATRLETLVLDSNDLGGPLPPSFSNLSSLVHFSAFRNWFNGSLPSALSNLQHLTHLAFHFNRLSGPLPDSLAHMTALKYLHVAHNRLYATLPAFLGNLTNLEFLNMGNTFSQGTLPAGMFDMTALTALHLDGNFRLSGSIPEAIGNLKQLQRLDLSYNRYSEPIPNSIGNLSNLEELYLDYNSLSGTIPASIANLARLRSLDLSVNRLAGIIPAALTTLTALSLFWVQNNQLVGALPRFQGVNVDARINYLTAVQDPLNGSSQQCAPELNCVTNTPSECGQGNEQRSASECRSFCGNDALSPPCGGHGVCSFVGAISDAHCTCDEGFTQELAGGTCIPQGMKPPVGNQTFVTYSSSIYSMALINSTSSLFEKSIFLASAPSTASWGAAFTQQPLALFRPTTRKAPCDQPIAFSVYFAFRMTPDTADAGSDGYSIGPGGEGLAFFVSAAAPQGAAAGAGLRGVGRRSVGVEFDSVLSVKHSDPNDNHVGVNVGGSPVSLASATAPLILNDAQTKHAWIHYDPTSGGTLRVFLSASRQQPSKPLLTARVSLCSTLKPTMGDASFLFGFMAASANNAQKYEILWWKIVTGMPPPVNWQNRAPGSAFGRVASAEEVAAGSEGESVLSSFHYASLAFQANEDGLPSWNLPPFVSWMRDETAWPVKSQHGCADSSAFAVVAALEAAYSIASGWSQPPRLSVEHVRGALSSNCDDMSPRDVLAFLAAATHKGGGLVDEAAAAGASQRSMASAGRRERLQKPKYYGIQGFEETSFGGWLGLLLAVQRQPVVVRIEASAPSFIDYDGTSKYADSSCFQGAVNHAVLLVGYAVEGSASSPFSLPAPLWVIRNSWGSGWGDAGHMLMDMQSGPGVCGINTLPGLFPILRAAADPCGSKSVQLAASPGVAASNAFNPCGQFKCSKAGASNRCACAAPHFVQAAHADGSNTCAYVDACGLAGSNPCVVGTCVNDGKGSYSCVCPPGFIQGTTAKGTLSCAPGESKGSYTVRGSNVWCSHLLPVLGLPLDQLKQQNKKLSCSKPIPVGFKLTVKLPQSLPNCSLFYTTQPGDSCASVAALFNLTKGCPVEGEACGEAVVGLNPGVDCAALTGSQAVCVEREESKAGVVAVCEQQYEVQGSGGCDAARMAVDPPLSPLEFYRLNPGINCNTRLPTDSIEGYSQRKVCIGSSTSYRFGTCPGGGTYTVAAGDSCAMIDVMGFASIKGCYRKLNGFECLEKMPAGTTVCTPDASRARVGNCSVEEYQVFLTD